MAGSLSEGATAIMVASASVGGSKRVQLSPRSVLRQTVPASPAAEVDMVAKSVFGSCGETRMSRP